MRCTRRSWLLVFQVLLIVMAFGIMVHAAPTATTEPIDEREVLYDLKEKPERVGLGKELRQSLKLPGAFEPPPSNEKWEDLAVQALQAEAVGRHDSEEIEKLGEMIREMEMTHKEIVDFRKWLESSKLVAGGPGGPGDPGDPERTGNPDGNPGGSEGDPGVNNPACLPSSGRELESVSIRFRVTRPAHAIVNNELVITPEVTVRYYDVEYEDCGHSRSEMERTLRSTSEIQIDSIRVTPSEGLIKAEQITHNQLAGVYHKGDIVVMWSKPGEGYRVDIDFYPVINGHRSTDFGRLSSDSHNQYEWVITGETTDTITVMSNRSNIGD